MALKDIVMNMTRFLLDTAVQTAILAILVYLWLR